MTSYQDYTYKRNFLSGIKPDQTVIIKKRFLEHLPNQELPTPSVTSLTGEWYPFVNSYYQFTEDVDAFARTHHLEEAKRSTDSFEKEYPAKQINEYSEERAEQLYLSSKPTYFLILGKPGLGEEELGRRLAEFWKCVYVDPLVLLEEEIASDSRPGQCIDFNLRCGRAVGVDVLMRLLAKKLQSPAVLHRGCVCCGFPLIPNDLYEEDPISSESAVFNVREIFEEIMEQAVHLTDISGKVAVSMIDSTKEGEVSEPEEVEPGADESIIKMSLEWSVENQICGPADISTDSEKQLNLLFGLFQDPFFLIYIYGKNSDVVAKRGNYYYDIYSRKELDMQKIRLFYEIGALDDNLTEELFDRGNNPFAENPALKHIVRLPENLPANVSTQLDRYHSSIANELDCHVLQHPCQYYIKLDARSFVSQMIKLVKLRLHVLPLQPVIIPEKFGDVHDAYGEDVDPNEAELSVEEAFRKFSKQNIVGPAFQWVWSDWGTFCPVSMFQGTYQKGSSKFAVHFLNKIYFLADEESYLKFVENPRPYLQPPFPKVGSKILVFGPPVSGKSAVSKCLGYLLNAKVLTPDEMYREYFVQMEEEYKEQIKQTAMAEAMEMLKAKYLAGVEEKGREKEKQISIWEQESLELLAKLKEALIKSDTASVDRFSSFPMKINKENEEEVRSLFDVEGGIQQDLKALNFPEILDEDQCIRLMEDRDALYEHLPENLREATFVEPPSPLDPFVLDYANSKVESLSTEDIKRVVDEDLRILDVYVPIIRSIEQQSDYDGWIIDGMSTDLNSLRQICEELSVDGIIVLTCSDNSFLIERLRQGKKQAPNFYNFRSFFLSIAEKDAAWRVPPLASSESYKNVIISDILDDIVTAGFDQEVVHSETEAQVQAYQELLEIYEKEIVAVRDFFGKGGFNPIYLDVQSLSIEDLLKESVNALRNQYRRNASELTETDRAEEIQQFLAQAQPGDVEGADQDVDSIIARNRRYGDTSFYCPVTFAERTVLWRGKEQFAAKFKDKIYLMSSVTNLKNFVRFPRKYLPEAGPPTAFPPPRICVIGPNSDLGNRVSRELARNLGVQYLDFAGLKRKAIEALSTMSLALDTEEQDLPDALTYAWFEALFAGLYPKESPLGGFVFDGFPQRTRDLDYMLFHQAAPDVVICIITKWEDHLRLELDKFLTEWRHARNEQRQEDELVNARILSDWEGQRQMRYNELMEANRENRYNRKISGDGPGVEEERFASDTQISFDSVIEQQEHDETMKILDEELPEPILEVDYYESEEEASANFTTKLEESYKTFSQFYGELKEVLDLELIPRVDIDGSEDVEKIIRQALIIGNELKFRSPSLFERCYETSPDVAEKLLACGYYLMSFFGRYCPVQWFEGRNPLQMYFANELKGDVCPVIHRQYIYFLYGARNRDKFCRNPLKYTSERMFNFPIVPARIAVIGPPKSGKTSLANRFVSDLGFRVISRGGAGRYILSHPLYTNLKSAMEDLLRKGKELTDEIMAECVYAASFCGESTTQGLVFDGFPNTIAEVTLLSRFGLVPHLIFDLQVGEEQVYKQASNPNDKTPLYSQRFVGHLWKEWRKDEESYRIWCDREYQNIYKLPVDRCIWGVWSQAQEVALAAVFERKHYYQHARLDWPLRLGYMLVTPLEFLERQSTYKTYCPGCLYYSRRFVNGGDPPDRTGLVQYGKHFYWLCEKHIEEFLKHPGRFLPPSNVLLPQELPKVVRLEEEPESAVEEGYCLVCYRWNFPKKVLTKGSVGHAVSHMGRIFLFDSRECLDRFVERPEEFCNLTINFKSDSLPMNLNYRELPVLGMLEQYVARRIVHAVNHVNVHRPVIPGLSISQAALISIGLNLKAHNRRSPDYRMYEQALQTFHQRRLDLLKYLDLMKKYLNPMVHYEEPDTPSSTDEDVES